MIQEKENYYILNNYLEILQNMYIPKECEVRHYYISEGKRRKFIRLYRNELFSDNKDTKKERKNLIAKIKVGELENFPKLVSPHIKIAKDCTDTHVRHAGMYYLLEKIVIHIMTDDFNDPLIEKSDLWYNLKELKKLALFSDKLEQYEWDCIIGYALASRLFQNYLADPNKVSKDIKKVISRKAKLTQLFDDYEITIDNPEIITDLRNQEKILIMNKK